MSSAERRRARQRLAVTSLCVLGLWVFAGFLMYQVWFR